MFPSYSRSQMQVIEEEELSALLECAYVSVLRRVLPAPYTPVLGSLNARDPPRLFYGDLDVTAHRAQSLAVLHSQTRDKSDV